MSSSYETKKPEPAAATAEAPVAAAARDEGDSVFTGLFRKFDRTQSNVYSPLSLEQALVVPYVGSDGETKEILAKEFNRIIPADMFPIDFYCDVLNKSLEATGVVSIGNAIWINDKSGFKVNAPFAKCVEKMCRVESLPFDEKFQMVLDNFVNEKTKTMIKNGPKIDCNDPLLCVIVLNTLFFEGKWDKAFESAVEEDFTLASGTVIPHQMMTTELARCNYYEDDTICAVELPYKNEFSMLVCLTKGTSLALTDLSDMKFSELRMQMKPRRVKVTLPKFTAESTISILEPLSELTSEKIKGYYNQMGNDPLKISAIIQQCKIEVDESGTRAAAVTTVLMRKECCSKTPALQFKADKPFMYHIMKENKILFMGNYMGK
ncbi:MAG: putative heterochromatin-associated protein MENT-like [Harvfovirus sp.]|uniref:Putative heterochromatin-associated protein MENT-like n=1 Tax=Harvfovirus sp. TaxID=2487768 RepID=A0A3G5A2K7_9VIRU|nr:MAG: putative heterochromatin-associated protein MENT-like [Harvfovirus sp.]